MNGSVRVYRVVLRCYPRRFREEYGADMALLFADQLQDEPAGRVWVRSVIDLAITVPTRHLEAHMDRSPTPAVPIFYAAMSIAGLVLGVVVGSNLGFAAFGFALAVIAGVFSVASWRSTRAVTTARPSTAHWWHVLLVGVGVLASTIAVVNVAGEIPEGWWAPMVFTLLSGIVLTVIGLILGIANFTSSRPTPTSS